MKKTNRRVRLYVVAAVFAVCSVVLWARLVQVQVLNSGRYDDIAQNQWRVTRAVSPVRGGIYDRNGDPLALSVQSHSVSVTPKAVEDGAAVARTLSRALKIPQSTVRSKLRSDKKFVWVKRRVNVSEKTLSKIRSLAGVEVRREADRVYPFGATGAKVVGFVGDDNVGRAGVEAAFDGDLAGTPGWEQVQRDGRYRSNGYFTYDQQRPVDGCNVILTLDVRLQEIAEAELARAVRFTSARSGLVISMDPTTGDMLALAEYPSASSRRAPMLADSLWTLRSLAHIYEPGSTFKLVTAAALLETGAVNSDDIFDADEGKADMGVAVIKDSHPHGELTFREGYTYSSNIVMAKASLSLDPKQFMEYIRTFGFGSRTGIELLGESAGTVAPVENWSDRTQITLAFGQEIAVTPIQLLCAFAAVANDGEMMLPRIVRAVYDERTERHRSFDPVRVRRVVSKKIARTLQSYCREVVTTGTGSNAVVKAIPVAGKTGTAEKASKRGGYHHDKFVASFIGFAPADDPRIVTLVVLDEPRYVYRFGGTSAAPVFARMTRAIMGSTDLFDEAVEARPVEVTSFDSKQFSAPAFLGMAREQALAAGRDMDLNVLCQGDGETIVAQDPDPGVAMARDDVVRLFTSAEPGKTAGVPNVRGLSMRAAKRKLAEAGFKCRVVGTGFVAQQRPAAGEKTKGRVTIVCRQRAM